jgi:hypothetical protein
VIAIEIAWLYKKDAGIKQPEIHQGRDRHNFARGFLFGAAAALIMSFEAVLAMPLDTRAPAALDDWIMKAQAVVVRPLPRCRPRRRAWRCRWNRGRRVCDWRWV